MTMHRAQYRRVAPGVWMVGCTCTWRVDHPLRGERSRAQVAWRAHRDAVTTERLGRLAQERPVGMDRGVDS